MLEDRDYMRAQGGGGGFRASGMYPAWLVILVINVVVFLIEFSGGPQMRQGFLKYGALSVEGIKHGFFWQLLTFQFLHGGLMHLVVNSLVLYSFGRVIEQLMGTRSFLKLYLLSGLAGGILQMSLALMSAARFGGPMVGASAGICGLVAAFALINPHSTIYLFFFIPIRAIYFLPLLIGLSAVFIVLPTSSTGPQVAHAAHLGGLLFGVAWIKYGWGNNSGAAFGNSWSNWFRNWRPLHGRQRKRELVRAASLRARKWRPGDPEADLPSEEFISKEVDPILDKISAHGIQSLTERERNILDAARKKMAKR